MSAITRAQAELKAIRRLAKAEGRPLRPEERRRVAELLRELVKLRQKEEGRE